MESIRILLVDDHASVRARIRDRLCHETDFEIVGEAETSAQAIECALALRPHIVLIDPMMRDGLGLEATRQIATRLPDTAVVVLTAFADTAQMIELRKAGTRYILNKGIESRRLVDILQDLWKHPAG
ncbi:MAG: response regulator transcription factor [Anaerolineae bacterium]